MQIKLKSKIFLFNFGLTHANIPKSDHTTLGNLIAKLADPLGVIETFK